MKMHVCIQLSEWLSDVQYLCHVYGCYICLSIVCGMGALCVILLVWGPDYISERG